MTTFALRRRPWRSDVAAQALADTGTALAVALIAAVSTLALDTWGVRRGLAAGALVLVLAWLLTTRRTLLALAFVMVYIGALDGYAKLSTGSQAVTLVRDLLLFAVVVGTLLHAQVRGVSLRLPPLGALVLVYVAIVLAQLLNPNGGTLSHSLAGVRQHLEFVPLFFLVFAFVRSKRALRVFVLLLALIATANGIVGWMQFDMTPQQLASWGPGYAERVLGEGRFVDSGRGFHTENAQRTRPFALGSDVGAGGLVGAFAVGAVLALAALAKRPRGFAFALAMAIGVALAIVSSQARSAVVGGVVVALTFGVLTAVSTRRVTGLLGIAAAGLVALFVVQAFVSSVGAENLRYEGLSTSRILQTTQQDRGQSIAAIPENIVHFPFGAGLATAGPASGVAGGSPLVDAVDAETWFSFQTLETGVPGMLLVLAFTGALLVFAFTRVRREPDQETRLLLAAAIAPVAAILVLYTVGGGSTATTPTGPYLWAAGGLVAYWLIERQRRPA